MKSFFSLGFLLNALAFFYSFAEATDFSSLTTSSAIAGVEKQTSVNDWTGLYLEKSELCTYLDGSAECSAKFNDCLSIKPVALGFQVELTSTQAYQHVCAFSLVMVATGSGLVYKSEVGQVLLKQSGGFLEIFSEGVDPTALGLGVCGGHADIDGLRFSIANKVSSSLQCSSPK
ncbi:hypothetical protein [Pseudomonas sp. PDM31]|uniref:hypothetical protein n=1 Tax=Pseudomonas sp. PDM31 TaxID=2854778 RepID=UPI001C492620|nr:hypothetical protein [Pseudomonas sp. PDM31]MBV7478048.1 hypothetical protein [Pseudomonas sp. PDM31]